MSLFPRIFFLVCGEYVVRFPLPVVFFYLVTASWIFTPAYYVKIQSITQPTAWDFSSQNRRKTIKSLVHKIDFTLDEGKGRLNPSRDKNEGKHRRRKVEKSWVTFLLCDPGWCVHKSDLNKKKGDDKTQISL